MKSKKSKKKGNSFLIIMLIPILMFLGVYIGGYFSGIDIISLAMEREIEEGVVDLEEFTLNLEHKQSNKNYIKVEISLTTLKEDGIRDLEENNTLIRGIIVRELSNKSLEFIYEEGKEGFEIKDIIKEAINDKMGRDLVNRVYITNILTN